MIILVLPDIRYETQLLDRARKGEQEALREIYERYFTPVYQFIRLRVTDVAVAEDIASNVFLKLVRAFRGGSPPRQSLRGWLFRVARNEIHDHYGRNQKINETVLEDWFPAPNENQPEVQFIRNLGIEHARQAILQLTDEQQEVILLRFGQMLSLQETADLMGKKVNAVKALQFRAVNALRRIMTPSETEDSHD